MFKGTVDVISSDSSYVYVLCRKIGMSDNGTLKVLFDQECTRYYQ